MTTILSLLTDVLAQGLVFVYPSVWTFWFIMHLNIDRWRRVGRRSFWIAALPWTVLGGSVLVFREDIFSVRWPIGFAGAIFGAAAFVAALLIGRSATRIIPRKTLVGVAELEPNRVHQPILNTGIYARTRNPIYLAHWLLIFSMAALTGYAANWILFAVDCFIIPLMILAEERELKDRYGAEFADYMRSVPRFFPRFSRESR